MAVETEVAAGMAAGMATVGVATTMAALRFTGGGYEGGVEGELNGGAEGRDEGDVVVGVEGCVEGSVGLTRGRS